MIFIELSGLEKHIFINFWFGDELRIFVKYVGYKSGHTQAQAYLDLV